MKKHLVVAKYREDVSWVANCPYETLIYDKSIGTRWKRNKSLPLVEQWQTELHFWPSKHIPLPNIGREAHTYLYHIIKNYDDLADLTFFTQGDPEPHKPNAKHHYFWDEPGSLTFYCWTPEWKCVGDGGPHHTGLPVAAIYETVMKQKAPEQFVYYPGAMFAVTANELRLKPVTFYEDLLRQLDVHGYAFPYAMERLWHTLLTTSSHTPCV